MAEVPITIACGNYDRTKAIKDGRVKVEGCAVNYLPLYPEEIFHRAVQIPGVRRRRDVVLELHPHGGGGHLGLRRHPGVRVAAVPALRHLCARRRRHREAGGPARQAHRPARIPDHRGGLDARHAAARIRREADGNPLAQRRPGGGRAAHERTPLKPIPGLDLKPIPSRTRRWSACCATASSTRCSPRAAPSSFLRGEPHIKRLFPDIRAAEHAYYKKTGLFPIMHLVGIRKSLVKQHPWLATSVYKAFCEAKALAMIDLLDVNALMVTLPWLEAETKETMAVMGKDFWRYGVAREPARDRGAVAVSARAGADRPQGRGRGAVPPSMFEISRV